MKSQRFILLAMLIALGIVLQIFESTLPLLSGVPGGKLGLANICTLLCICLLDPPSVFLLAAARPLLAGLLYGGALQMLYSISGSLLAAAVMLFCVRKWRGVSLLGAGVLGAAAHNTAQIAVAAVLYGNIYIFTYLPVLIILSLCSGYFTGLCCTIIVRHTAMGRLKNK